jgi:diacylglycerol O-acyltransferase / wax synthase
MVINGVLILAGPVDIDALEATLLERFLSIPRFRQRIESHSGEFWWCEDGAFDRRRHVKRVRLPGKGGRAELQDYVSDLASDPLDKARPLWQIRIIEHYEGGAVVLVRIHHAIADGIALVGVMLSITDHEGHAKYSLHTSARVPPRPWLAIPGLATLRQGLQLTSQVWQEAKLLAANPANTARTGAGIAGELAYLLLMPNDTPTRFKGEPGGEKRVAWTDPIPLPEVKAVSQVLGCSINDMLLASVAGALRAYLKDKGDSVDGVEIRALVPINMRTPSEEGALGNRFGIVAVELPAGIENPLARLQETRRRMTELKQSLEPPVTLGLLTALGYAPKMVQDRLFNLLLSRATAVMTNVPGPQTPLYLAGSLIKQVMFWVPQSADIGMGVSILSFNGNVQFGLMTDAALVPDPQAVSDHFKPEFEQLLYFVLMEPWQDDEDFIPPKKKAASQSGKKTVPARPSPPALSKSPNGAARRKTTYLNK